MVLKWSIQIARENRFAPTLAGLFYPINDELCFFYEHKGAVHKLILPLCADEMYWSGADNSRLPLPYHWGVFAENKTPYLICDERHCIDLTKSKNSAPCSQELMERYRRWRGEDTKPEERSFHFDSFTITHKGQFGYFCSENDRQCWFFRGQGYLYTEIVRWNDVIFFGTAGLGGYFYILDLKSGTPLLTLKTLGTPFILRHGEHCYIWQKGKPSRLLRVRLSSGEISAECILPDAPNDSSVMGVFQNTLYITTFTEKKGQLTGVYMNAVDISAEEQDISEPWHTYHLANGAVVTEW